MFKTESFQDFCTNVCIIIAFCIIVAIAFMGCNEPDCNVECVGHTCACEKPDRPSYDVELPADSTNTTLWWYEIKDQNWLDKTYKPIYNYNRIIYIDYNNLC